MSVEGLCQFRGSMPGRGLVPGWGLYRMGAIVTWGKSPVKRCLGIGASFKRVTLVTRSGSHLVRNISQRDPPT